MTYRAGHFERLYKSDIGQQTWAFLNLPESRTRLETASFLQRPAVEAIAPSLLQAFGPEVLGYRMKQMVGSMVRQILEAHGYRLERQHVPIPRRRRVVFSSGSRYVRTTGRAA